MKKYVKPVITIIMTETKTEDKLMATSCVLPDADDYYADIENGVVLPNGSIWD